MLSFGDASLRYTAVIELKRSLEGDVWRQAGLDMLHPYKRVVFRTRHGLGSICRAGLADMVTALGMTASRGCRQLHGAGTLPWSSVATRHYLAAAMDRRAQHQRMTTKGGPISCTCADYARADYASDKGMVLGTI